MTEKSGMIILNEGIIEYTSKIYSEWTISVDDLLLIGEATNQDGPCGDDYFLCFSTGLDSWYEAPFDSEGMNVFLYTLSAKLGIKIDLKLTSSTDFNSRVLWPIDLLEKPMFCYTDIPPKTIIGRLFGSMRTNQTYSDEMLKALLNDA